MSDTHPQRIAFKKLVRIRARVTTMCSLLLSLVLATNLMMLSNLSNFGGQILIADTPITVAVALSVITILVSAVMTLVYVIWANTRLDKLTREAIAELTGEASA